MKTLVKLLFILAFISFSGVSCDEHDVEAPKLNEETIKNNVFSSKLVMDLFLDIKQGAVRSKSASDSDDCTSVEYNLSEDMKVWTMSITYNNCEADGLVKNGKVEIEFGGSWETGCVAKIHFDGYSVNGYSVNGNMETKFEKIDLFNLKSDLKLIYADGSSTSWKDEKTVKMIDGSQWEINGTVVGKARNGQSFTRTEKGLIFSWRCPWYVDGEIKLAFNKDEVYDLTFGEECGEFNYTYKGIKTSVSMN